MPRKSRIDAPGSLQHISAKCIEQIELFQDDEDRNNFIARLEKIINETGASCYAWTIMPDHFHLLLKTNKFPIARIMRRLLTGYAISFNKKYNRHGHLFQNRYKSILCQEDIYLKELVRYIHLNPLRKNIVNTVNELDHYPYTGHRAIIKNIKNSWQDINTVLKCFTNKKLKAIKEYRDFVIAGQNQGCRPELTGGGLLRSYGGWSEVKNMRRSNICYKSDERILGNSDFVDMVLTNSKEHLARQSFLDLNGVDLQKVTNVVSDLFEIDSDMMLSPGKERKRVMARSLLCYWAARELNITMTELSQEMKLSLSAISLSVKRGEQISREKNLHFDSILKLPN